MRHLTRISAVSYSTFALAATLAEVYECDTIEELSELSFDQVPCILGEGSNSIFLTDLSLPVVRFCQKQRQVVAETQQQVQLHVGAGHNWHQLVLWSVAQGWWGLENLALIPGSVGAAPVQNIGAYGVELADCCDYVDFFHWQDRQVQRLSRNECQFGYRDSIFKHQLAGKGVIVAVGLTLQKQGQAKTGYRGLEQLTAQSPVQDVMATIIAVRQSKLPDPAQLANCGSFFKNPVIPEVLFQRLISNYPALPAYPQPDGQVKVAAGWLIEQAGFKGKRLGGIGCYELQALVLVNFGDGTAAELQQMIQLIRQGVLTMFQINLEPEVRLIGLTNE